MPEGGTKTLEDREESQVSGPSIASVVLTRGAGKFVETKEGQMPTVHTRFVVWESRGYRHKSGSGAVDITTPSVTTVTDGGTYSAYGFPDGTWTDSSGTHTGHFAFWSVAGAAGGGSFTPHPNLDVQVASTDVQATAWYIEGGTGGPGGPALLIDAFDVDIGDFVLDDFVDVVTDSSLTAEANADGIVPTGTDTEDVRAYTSIRSVPFKEWIVVEGAEPVSKEDLTGNLNTSAIAFAMYQSPPKQPKPSFTEQTWVSWSVTVDGGGPTGRGPQPPWNPYLRELAAGLALADTAGILDIGLRGSVLRLAAEQVQLAAENIVRMMEGGRAEAG
jgi:hypothetical protein